MIQLKNVTYEYRKDQPLGPFDQGNRFGFPESENPVFYHQYDLGNGFPIGESGL